MFPGKNPCLPSLPCVPGDEGIGDVVEIGRLVSAVEPGDRVVFTTRLLGTWRYYGVFHERDVHIVSPNLPLGDASMLTTSPCNAYRMIKDFRNLRRGDTVMQNAANSPIGQCVIQLCREWELKTFNIVATNCHYDSIKERLLGLGADIVCTLEEAEKLKEFTTSITRPVLALNCLGGRYEDVMLRLLRPCGTIVYYGCAYNLPICKRCLRCDVAFYKFHLCQWYAQATCIEKDVMLNDLTQKMVIKKLKAPVYEPIEFRNYIEALRYTVHCEAFAMGNYVFDFTIGS